MTSVSCSLLCLWLLAWTPLLTSASTLKHSRSQNRHLQRAIKHENIVFVLEGVRHRGQEEQTEGNEQHEFVVDEMEPILLVNFPDIDHQFKVREADKNTCSEF